MCVSLEIISGKMRDVREYHGPCSTRVPSRKEQIGGWCDPFNSNKPTLLAFGAKTSNFTRIPEKRSSMLQFGRTPPFEQILSSSFVVWGSNAARLPYIGAMESYFCWIRLYQPGFNIPCQTSGFYLPLWVPAGTSGDAFLVGVFFHQPDVWNFDI